jgi:peptide/nickel transport system substrate-binding protein
MRALALAVAVVAFAGVAATQKTASEEREGGTFLVSLPGEFVASVDPYLAEGVAAGFVSPATCSAPMRFPDKPPPAGYKVQPDIAEAPPTISNRGKTYTFTVRRGLRFSTGAPVTPRDVTAAFSRALNPKLQSPLASLYEDIVGAEAYATGKAATLQGVSVQRRRVVIRLQRPRAEFALRTAFACVVPATLPIDPEGVPAPVPSSGPYFVSEFEPGKRIVLERNRFYRGPRTRHVDRFTISLDDTDAIVDKIDHGQVDAGWVPNPVIADRAPELARRYGTHGPRFFVTPGLFLRLFVLNTSGLLFHDNVPLRRAVNFAVDRKALLRERGQYAGYLTDQYLPPTFPGYRNARIYPLKAPDVPTARALARGHLRSGKATFYGPNNPLGAAQGEILKRNLAEIGLTVDVKLFPPAVLFQKLATRGEPFDIGGIGWLSDPDPGLLSALFDGTTIGKPDFANYSYFNSPHYNRLLQHAAAQTGTARYRAYGSLDIDLAQNAAPAVAYAYDNALTLVGPRTRCVVLHPDLDLAAVCLK